MSGTLLALVSLCRSIAGACQAMKIYFLLTLMSLFVWLSYMPLGVEAKQKAAVRPKSFSA
jgi:hypothetical protein